ncbi:hypothetical protein EVAR_36025_1 [Eumeta japonica]|uniref:Uncharacterized protein n=1 Tax=Eumeta variegata TaxID=151549 RepID=A0A4C1WQ81_EUMVA|nr:hypothetical protein EVAR_36025_1 [Eumeta japonica]
MSTELGWRDLPQITKISGGTGGTALLASRGRTTVVGADRAESAIIFYLICLSLSLTLYMCVCAFVCVRVHMRPCGDCVCERESVYIRRLQGEASWRGRVVAGASPVIDHGAGRATAVSPPRRPHVTSRNGHEETITNTTPARVGDARPDLWDAAARRPGSSQWTRAAASRTV